jgi:O-antigen ligase
MHAGCTRNRILYGLAVCVLMAASLSTFRKTGLIAPVVVVLSIIFFRRRELLRLAPLAVVLIAVVHLLSPGALGGVLGQLSGQRLAIDNTTNHRAAGYEAIRPLVWTHPVLGLGYGGYDAFANYILDSEILTELMEVGVLGLLAYLIMILSVVATATPMIRQRDRERAPPALMAALTAIAFLTVSFLYDAMHFPHAPYIFLTLAALVAVLATSPTEPEKGAS